MPKYIQGCKLCPTSQCILFCSACMYKSAFRYNDGLAPSRRQATVLSNGDSFHWWAKLYGIYNYNWTHNIEHSRYLAHTGEIWVLLVRSKRVSLSFCIQYPVIVNRDTSNSVRARIIIDTFSTLLSVYNLKSMPISPKRNCFYWN